jgi:hypothetical protein
MTAFEQANVRGTGALRRAAYVNAGRVTLTSHSTKSRRLSY